VQRKSNPDLDKITSREVWAEFEAVHLRPLLRYEKIPGEKLDTPAQKPAEEDPWEQFNFTGSSEQQQAVRLEDDTEDRELESLESS